MEKCEVHSRPLKKVTGEKDEKLPTVAVTVRIRIRRLQVKSRKL
jgi:hypothetical protein